MIPRRFFWLLDAFAVAFAFALAYAAWPSVRASIRVIDFNRLPVMLRPETATGELPLFTSIAWLMLVAGAAAVVALELGDAYMPLLQQSRARVIVTSLAAIVAAAGVITLVLFFEKKSSWSRLFLSLFMLFGFMALAVMRMSLRAYFNRRRDAGFYTKHILLIGPRSVVKWLGEYIGRSVPATEYQISGYLAVAGDPGESDPGVERLGTVSELAQILISTRVDEVIAVQSTSGGEWTQQVIEDCDSLGILVRIIPEGLLFGTTRTLRTLYPFQLLHLPAVVLAPPHFDSDALFFKRVFDIVFSAALLIVLAPLFFVIAVLIKLTDRKSDIFYRWNVVGRNGVRFTGYKFTTMYSDADARRKELLDRNEMSGPVFKIREDPRVTPLGRFLRKYSLNELPQLWSVLKGDMSLVGPRPAFPHELEGYGISQKRKLSIRPGITCLWQVRGRNKISNFDDWVKMDLEYIDNWSLWLDFKILVRTAWAVVAGTGS